MAARRYRKFKVVDPALTTQVLEAVRANNGIAFAKLQEQVTSFSEREIYGELQRLRCEGQLYHHNRTGWHLVISDETTSETEAG